MFQISFSDKSSIKYNGTDTLKNRISFLTVSALNNNLHIYISDVVSWGYIFSRVQPLCERAVSDLDP